MTDSNPPDAPTPAPKVLLPRREVERRVGLSKSAIYDRMQKGTFPDPVRDLETATVWWLESEVEEWIDARIAARAPPWTLAGRTVGGALIFYPRHIGDGMRAAAALSLIEEGVFTRLADHYFSREIPLPLGFKDCCRIARASSKVERAAVERVLGELFERRENGFHRTEFDDEIEKFKSKSDKRRKAANSRWGKEKGRCKCIACGEQ